MLLNVFVGSAQGALEEGKAYTTTSSRPWIYSGVEKHTEDPWIKRQYGDLYIHTLAATELADQAARSLDAAFIKGPELTLEERSAAAIDIATANAPDDIEEFIQKVVPILQDRGVYRRHYEGKTVRDRYRLPYPTTIR